VHRAGFCFFIGVAVGALATLVFQRLSESREIDHAQRLAEEIEGQLDLLETKEAPPAEGA
jgi:hypothetical protein